MPTAEQQARIDQAVALLPPRLGRFAGWLLATWLGRTGIAFSFSLQRIEVFDRAMAIAAQLFTSVFPVLILLASWFGDGSTILHDAFGMPAEAENVVDDALNDGSNTTFSIIGALIVIVSATSLSRALARAFAIVWGIPRPKSNIASAWRWVAVVLGLAVILVTLRGASRITQDVPPSGFWTLVFVGFVYVVMAIGAPWILLKGVLTVRALLPGALIFGLVTLVIRPFSNAWLPIALERSATTYGSIGVAFTYLAWFYLFSWVYLASAVLGQVLINDGGRFGRWLAGPQPLVRLERAVSFEADPDV